MIASPILARSSPVTAVQSPGFHLRICQHRSSTTAEIKLPAMYSVSRLNQALEYGDPMVPTEIPEDDIVCEHHVRDSVLHGRMKHIDIADHVYKDWHA